LNYPVNSSLKFLQEIKSLPRIVSAYPFNHGEKIFSTRIVFSITVTSQLASFEVTPFARISKLASNTKFPFGQTTLASFTSS